MRAKSGARRIARSIGLPEDVLFHGARVTWFAGKSALVEGQRGVVELRPERIRLRTAEGILTLEGKALTLQELSRDAAMITGEQIDTITCR